ncbi:hypothetical protein [Arsenicicoccus dermatophilus]|uniref:hypothetical protein n=1 Tax=Arsenicicoccus dermatophilus TaxID=1076331 RepID=UPI001F4CE3D4|nr:hypothetical protein [Arsenicicoccus dermatophilus]MCH8612329.1 hypothetical protein [Arsenicicoccus dermatophilus]
MPTFDTTRLADYDPDRIAEIQRHEPELYANHLDVANWLEGWCRRLDESHRDDARQAGIAYALGEVVAHLRQGDFTNDEHSLITEEKRATRT